MPHDTTNEDISYIYRSQTGDVRVGRLVLQPSDPSMMYIDGGRDIDISNILHDMTVRSTMNMNIKESIINGIYDLSNNSEFYNRDDQHITISNNLIYYDDVSFISMEGGGVLNYINKDISKYYMKTTITKYTVFTGVVEEYNGDKIKIRTENSPWSLWK